MNTQDATHRQLTVIRGANLEAAKRLSRIATIAEMDAYLAETGSPYAGRQEPGIVQAAFLGACQHVMSMLAFDFEQAAAENAAPVTGRDVLPASMGAGNVSDDDEESLQFADESEWMDDGADV